jgi:hypothetical protein
MVLTKARRGPRLPSRGETRQVPGKFRTAQSRFPKNALEDRQVC